MSLVPPEILRMKPPASAVAFLQGKTLQPSFHWTDVWQQEHAKAFIVAGVMATDVLQDIKDGLDEAQRQGLPFAQFQRSITPILDAKGWTGERTVKDPKTGDERVVQITPRRLNIIYDANMRVASAVRQWERYQETKRTLPYLRYRNGAAIHHRLQHVAFNGKILHIDDPWWDVYFPPNGWLCHCFTEQLSERQAMAEGGVDESPEIQYVDWKNARSNAVLKVPIGVDPGWGYNPGKAGLAERHQLVGRQ